MKVAAAYENGEVFQHFGHTKQFKVYEIEDGKVVSSEIIETNGQGHSALADFLHEQAVSTVICGGIGEGAQAALTEQGIELFAGVSGQADEAVEISKGSLLLPVPIVIIMVKKVPAADTKMADVVLHAEAAVVGVTVNHLLRVRMSERR